VEADGEDIHDASPEEEGFSRRLGAPVEPLKATASSHSRQSQVCDDDRKASVFWLPRRLEAHIINGSLSSWVA
jgi:hypothetical protein